MFKHHQTGCCPRCCFVVEQRVCFDGIKPVGGAAECLVGLLRHSRVAAITPPPCSRGADQPARAPRCAPPLHRAAETAGSLRSAGRSWLSARVLSPPVVVSVVPRRTCAIVSMVSMPRW